MNTWHNTSAPDGFGLLNRRAKYAHIIRAAFGALATQYLTNMSVEQQYVRKQ